MPIRQPEKPKVQARCNCHYNNCDTKKNTCLGESPTHYIGLLNNQTSFHFTGILIPKVIGTGLDGRGPFQALHGQELGNEMNQTRDWLRNHDFIHFLVSYCFWFLLISDFLWFLVSCDFRLILVQGNERKP